MLIQTFLFIALPGLSALGGQNIPMTESASPEHIYGETVLSETLLPMNELNMGEFGYILYSTEVSVDHGESILALENVRDYAAVYLDAVFQGSVSDGRKELLLAAAPGKYRLDLYAENIGRITYGPEVLDNLKGLFGSATLNGAEIRNWTITPLHVRECDVSMLEFSGKTDAGPPGFCRGFFDVGRPQDIYLDISGWVMGEVWLNGVFMGAFWEEEKQQSIRLPADAQKIGRNEIVVFELRNNGRNTMKLSEKPIFK